MGGGRGPPHCPRARSGRRISPRSGRADEGTGPVRRDHLARIRRPRPARRDLRQDRGQGRGRVDGAVGHLQLAPHHGLCDRAGGHKGTEGGVVAEDGDRRVARRHRPDRSQRGHRPSGDPDQGHPDRRRLQAQRHQDLDHQFALRQLPDGAGQDRSRRHAAPQGDERVHHPEGRGVRGLEEADEDGLSVHRQLRVAARRHGPPTIT